MDSKDKSMSSHLEPGNTVTRKSSCPVYTSEQVLQGNPEAIIIHADQEYRLRQTSNGKLILTK